MARYDRIAPISAPGRESVFPGWLVLRDLEGRDRDTDLARRARLRYLALRPVSRLLHCGVAAVSADSYMAEIEAAREDLGYLPARDAERARLARFLHQIEQRESVGLISALLDVAEALNGAGYTYGAEEYALIAEGLAAAAAEYRLQGAANVVRARVYRHRGQVDNAKSCAQVAEAIARRTENHADLVEARGELALCAATQRDANAAHAIVQQTLKEMRAFQDTQAEALLEARSCAIANLLGNASVALDHASRALPHIEEPRERAVLLEQIGIALSAAGYYKQAERCFTIVAHRAPDAGTRARARAWQAVETAAAGAANAFRDRRRALLDDPTEWSADPRAAAFIHLELGRGCLIVHDVDFARDHLRAAITTARKHNLSDILSRAETVLTALETNSTDGLVGGANDAATTANAQAVAAQLAALPDFSLVPA